VLAVGYQKQSEGNAQFALGSGKSGSLGAGGAFAPYMRSYMYRSGAPEDVGPMVAVKDRLNALKNPYAHLKIEDISLEKVKASPMMWDPVRYLESCPSSDGACAVVLTDEAGGTAHLYGVSSGAALALEAAAAGLPIAKVAAYEVPYDVSEGARERHLEYTEKVQSLLADDRRDDAMRLFMRLAGAPEEAIAQAHNSPMWAGSIAVAHTLAYDAVCLGDGTPPTERLATIKQPVLVATGGTTDETMAGLGAGFFDAAADAVTAAIPGAERAIIPNQGHVADPEAVVPVATRFFNA
jgi:hypothetical protein